MFISDQRLFNLREVEIRLLAGHQAGQCPGRSSNHDGRRAVRTRLHPKNLREMAGNELSKTETKGTRFLPIII